MTTLLLARVPDSFEIEPDGDGFVVTIPVLSGVEGFRYVALAIRLDRIPNGLEGVFEFSYGFEISDLEGNELSYFTQDRYDIERYFDGLSREHVLPTICSCLTELVEAVQPSYIYRVAKGRSLPDKAMAKHHLVTETLLGLGFEVVQTGTDDFDRLFWSMSR
jgi:hypothetical protein